MARVCFVITLISVLFRMKIKAIWIMKSERMFLFLLYVQKEKKTKSSTAVYLHALGPSAWAFGIWSVKAGVKQACPVKRFDECWCKSIWPVGQWRFAELIRFTIFKWACPCCVELEKLSPLWTWLHGIPGPCELYSSARAHARAHSRSNWWLKHHDLKLKGQKTLMHCSSDLGSK